MSGSVRQLPSPDLLNVTHQVATLSAASLGLQHRWIEGASMGGLSDTFDGNTFKGIVHFTFDLPNDCRCFNP